MTTHQSERPRGNAAFPSLTKLLARAVVVIAVLVLAPTAHAVLTDGSGSVSDIPYSSKDGIRVPVLFSGPSSPPLQSNGNGLEFSMNSTGDSNADAGFQKAADYWSSQFGDDITVNLTIGFSSLGGSILGSASSTQATYSYGTFTAALAGDATTADDNTAVTNLPAGASLDMYLNRTSNNPNGSGSATPYLDNDGDANNTTLRLTNANAKALGLIAHNQTGQDAAITFNSDFSFDFDPSDGIDAGKIDFVGVAIHEIGHAMGFISGVDILDINSPPVNGPFADNQFTFVSALDLFRRSDASDTAGADIDWTADTRTKYFSIDGGNTKLVTNAFSTGVNFGDGRQASHWKDNLGLGIMDPTAAPAGNAMVVTALDLQAFDVIGWDPIVAEIPEPGALVMLAVVLVGLIGVRRRRR